MEALAEALAAVVNALAEPVAEAVAETRRGGCGVGGICRTSIRRWSFLIQHTYKADR